MLSFLFVIVCGLCELKRFWLFIFILPLDIQLSRWVWVWGGVVVFYVFNDLRSEVTVRFVDIGGIVDHHS